jgi:hypothetical protein
MGATYTLPIASDLHRVRLLIGDTNVAVGKFHLDDDEIRETISLAGEGTGSVYEAAALCCESIASRRAEASFSLTAEGVTLDRDPVYQAWTRKAERFWELVKRVPVHAQVGYEDKDVREVEQMLGLPADKRDDVVPEP